MLNPNEIFVVATEEQIDRAKDGKVNYIDQTQSSPNPSQMPQSHLPGSSLEQAPHPMSPPFSVIINNGGAGGAPMPQSHGGYPPMQYPTQYGPQYPVPIPYQQPRRPSRIANYIRQHDRGIKFWAGTLATGAAVFVLANGGPTQTKEELASWLPGTAGGSENQARSNNFNLNPRGLSNLEVSEQRITHKALYAVAYGADGAKEAGWYQGGEDMNTTIDRDIAVFASAPAITTEVDGDTVIASIDREDVAFTFSLPTKTESGTAQEPFVYNPLTIDVDKLRELIKNGEQDSEDVVTVQQAKSLNEKMNEVLDEPIPFVEKLLEHQGQSAEDYEPTTLVGQEIWVLNELAMVANLDTGETRDDLVASTDAAVQEAVEAQLEGYEVEYKFSGEYDSFLKSQFDALGVKPVKADEVLQVKDFQTGLLSYIDENNSEQGN